MTTPACIPVGFRVAFWVVSAALGAMIGLQIGGHLPVPSHSDHQADKLLAQAQSRDAGYSMGASLYASAFGSAGIARTEEDVEAAYGQRWLCAARKAAGSVTAPYPAEWVAGCQLAIGTGYYRDLARIWAAEDTARTPEPTGQSFACRYDGGTTYVCTRR